MNAIKIIQGDFSFADAPFETNTPFAHIYKQNGTETAAVAFVILRGGDAIPDTQAFLDFYDMTAGQWKLIARAPSDADFSCREFFVAPLDPGLTNESWWLAWGMRIGDTGTRVKVRVYAFDGRDVRTVWKRDGLTRGKASATKTSVKLQYDRTYEPQGHPERIIENYDVTANGLYKAP